MLTISQFLINIAYCLVNFIVVWALWLDKSECYVHYSWREALQSQQYLIWLFLYRLWPQALPQAKTVRFEHQPTCTCQL